MLERVINSKFVKDHIVKTINSPSYAAKFLVGAAVAKDAFEYTVSTAQILKNKEIPPKKRKLVAAMDGATGVLSCLSQLAVGFTLASDKVQKRMSDFLFKDLVKKVDVKTLEKCKAGLAIASSLIITSLVVKRILVPMFAAPIANYGTEFLGKYEKCKKEQYFD
jgi:hypothetical protein